MRRSAHGAALRATSTYGTMPSRRMSLSFNGSRPCALVNIPTEMRNAADLQLDRPHTPYPTRHTSLPFDAQAAGCRARLEGARTGMRYADPLGTCAIRARKKKAASKQHSYLVGLHHGHRALLVGSDRCRLEAPTAGSWLQLLAPEGTSDWRGQSCWTSYHLDRTAEPIRVPRP